MVPAVRGVFSLCKEVDLKVLGSGRRESVVDSCAGACVKGVYKRSFGANHLKKKKNLLCGVCFISGRSYFCLEPGKG